MSPVLLLIDNYDSFTYNIVDYLRGRGHDVAVIRNDQYELGELVAMAPKRLLVSPGPGTPADGGISNQAIGYFAGRIPVLGVCLGHQCLAAHYGGRVVRAHQVMHGKTSAIVHDGTGLFEGVPKPLIAMRYNSLLVDSTTLPGDFAVTAHSDAQEIMAIRHRPSGAVGVQFHPESIATRGGTRILENFATC